MIGFVMNFNLNTLSIFPYLKAKGVPKLEDYYYTMSIQAVINF